MIDVKQLIIDFFIGLRNSSIYFYDNEIGTLDADWLKPILDKGNRVDLRGDNLDVVSTKKDYTLTYSCSLVSN